MKTNLASEAKRILQQWSCPEFKRLIKLHGQDLFEFALQISIHDLAPNELDSLTREKLTSRLHHHFGDIPTLQGLRLEHSLGL